MRYLITYLLLFITVSTASASDLVHSFTSPAFSGIGYSSHILTIEQLEENRRQKIKDDKKSAADKAERDLKSTNAYKFKNNLESRIYTWYESETPFGDNVKWKRGTDARIYVIITDSNGDVVAEFDVPVGEFAF